MKTAVKLAAAVLVGIPLTAVGQGQPKLTCAKDITYSKEFLTKFPDAGAACQEVRLIKGEKWVRFDAQVKYNKDLRITVDFLNTDQNHNGAPITFEYTPDATLMLENQKVKTASRVEKGDKVWIWVPESRFGLYSEPGASESKHFAIVSDSAK